MTLMPPLRSDRAPRACEACRRLKTRCYPSKHGKDSCLRCETQDRDCSLKKSSRPNGISRSYGVESETSDVQIAASDVRVEERLARLESLVHTVVDRLDSLTRQSSAPHESGASSVGETRSPPSTSEHDAPVFLIKGIAENACLGNQDSSEVPDDDSDPVLTGIIGMEDAYELLYLFRTHYGRWVNFDDNVSIEQLMSRVRASPLLFHSICLVAARHTTQQHTNELAPTFFREAKRLLQASLLSTPQRLEFFQAALLLSLWSTTIGQVPLSIDSWLLTSYALQQGIASSMATSIKGTPADDHRLRAACTWNHICIAHLQYCVGTGRRCLLQEAQIDRCADVLEFDVSQFEVRMVAELRLYWIIVKHCCAQSVNLSNIRTLLYNWRKEWSVLFDQPRSQFLEMSYNFAFLIAHCRSLRSQTNKLSRFKLSEMVQRARDIISVAIAHTDERTPHLTDHIYHLITFSAITLCQLITKYPNILVEPNEVTPLHNVILGLVEWLRSIGLASHISRVLANIIEAHYAKSTTRENPDLLQLASGSGVTNTNMPQTVNADLTSSTNFQPLPDRPFVDYAFQDLGWTTFFDFNADTVSWPQSNEFVSSTYTPTNESWNESAHAASP